MLFQNICHFRLCSHSSHLLPSLPYGLAYCPLLLCHPSPQPLLLLIPPISPTFTTFTTTPICLLLLASSRPCSYILLLPPPSTLELVRTADMVLNNVFSCMYIPFVTGFTRIKHATHVLTTQLERATKGPAHFL